MPGEVITPHIHTHTPAETRENISRSHAMQVQRIPWHPIKTAVSQHGWPKCAPSHRPSVSKSYKLTHNSSLVSQILIECSILLVLCQTMQNFINDYIGRKFPTGVGKKYRSSHLINALIQLTKIDSPGDSVEICWLFLGVTITRGKRAEK